MNEAEFNAILSLLETMNIYFKSGDYRCVIETLTSEYQYDEDKYRCYITSKNCKECITKHLQKAVERIEKGEGQ